MCVCAGGGASARAMSETRTDEEAEEKEGCVRVCVTVTQPLRTEKVAKRKDCAHLPAAAGTE